MMGGFGDMMGGGLLGGGLFMLLFWGGLILLIVLGAQALFRQSGNSGSGGGSGRSALDILKERYARGEIGQEEYQNMRRNLLS